MKLYQVDAFTSALFKGNPAGVCLLEKPVEDEWMRNVAMAYHPKRDRATPAIFSMPFIS